MLNLLKSYLVKLLFLKFFYKFRYNYLIILTKNNWIYSNTYIKITYMIILKIIKVFFCKHYF